MEPGEESHFKDVKPLTGRVKEENLIMHPLKEADV
jgi:hypothetical protein